jgi:hypothetical protein
MTKINRSFEGLFLLPLHQNLYSAQAHVELPDVSLK